MVGVFGRFDLVEEAAVDDGLASSGDGGEERGCAVRVAPGHDFAPELMPTVRDRGGRGVRRPADEGWLVEERVSEAAIAPIEDGH